MFLLPFAKHHRIKIIVYYTKDGKRDVSYGERHQAELMMKMFCRAIASVSENFEQSLAMQLTL